jgi:hypothetical protein
MASRAKRRATESGVSRPPGAPVKHEEEEEEDEVEDEEEDEDEDSDEAEGEDDEIVDEVRNTRVPTLVYT